MRKIKILFFVCAIFFVKNMANQKIETKQKFTGRSMIFCDQDFIDNKNIVEQVNDAYFKHLINRTEINTLYDYYKGYHEKIMSRVKPRQKDIQSFIKINTPYEIVEFYKGYVAGDSIKYTSRKGSEVMLESIDVINDYMEYECKDTKDQELIEWGLICGTGYKMVLPEKDETPFSITVLDPRNTFVVYKNDLYKKPLYSVSFVYKTDRQEPYFYVYTQDKYFEISNGEIIKEDNNTLKKIPIIEYPLNKSRIGSFEIVLDLIDMQDELMSCRQESISSFVASFFKFINCNIDEKTFQKLKELGAISIKSIEGLKADIDLVSKELNQTQTQTLADFVYDTICIITGLPSTNNTGSSSSNNGAEEIRGGWQQANARAKNIEQAFKKSERELLKLVIQICSNFGLIKTDYSSKDKHKELTVFDIDIKFTRRNYENIQSKAQVFIQMLSNDFIDPIDAYTKCGLFEDPQSAYERGMKWHESKKNEALKDMEDDIKMISHTHIKEEELEDV